MSDDAQLDNCQLLQCTNEADYSTQPVSEFAPFTCQLLQCTNEPDYPSASSIPSGAFQNDAVFYNAQCPFGDTLQFTGSLPSWISIDTTTGLITGAAGVFNGATQIDAQTAAQDALNAWVGENLASGAIHCAQPVSDVLLMPDNQIGSVLNFNQISAFGLNGTFYTTDGSDFYSSPDGQTWTQVGSDAAISGCNTIAGNSSVFVAVTGLNSAYYSADQGATWSTTGITTNSNLVAVIFANGLFVAAGSFTGSAATTSSSDGITWTDGSGVVDDILAIAASSTTFAVVGNGGAIYSSVDGSSWTPRSSGTTAAIRCIIWTGSQFVAGVSDGTVLISNDGISWTLITANIGEIRSIAFGGGIYVVGDSNSNVFSSSDLTNWSIVPVTSSGNYRLVACVHISGTSFFLDEENPPS